MTDSPTNPLQPLPAVIAEHRGWFVFLGIALIVIGAVAITFPLMTTIAAKIFVGWLFLVGGILQVVHAFSTQKWSEFLLSLLIGALYVIAGAWLAFLPFTGIITLTDDGSFRYTTRGLFFLWGQFVKDMVRFC